MVVTSNNQWMSLLDNAPNYLVGCVIQMRNIRLYLSGLEFSCWTFLHSRSTSVTCNVFDLGKASSRVECHLECQKHWKPINDTTVTTCYPETSRNDHFYGSKLTNFTIDYLECQRMDD